MEQGTQVRNTRHTVFIPPFSTAEIPIHIICAHGPGKSMLLQFVPRHRSPFLRISNQLLGLNASSLQASNTTSRPVCIPGQTVLGTLKAPTRFRFYDLPRELRDTILGFTLEDEYPDEEVLTLKSKPGFVKSSEDGSIALTFRSTADKSQIAFPFKSRFSLALASKTMADEYHDALLRLLLRKENAWLKMEIDNFDFSAAQEFLRSCPPQQVPKLRSPGKLALNLSIDDWDSIGWWLDTHEQWYANTR
jgi:hypothetical protein